MSWNNLFLPFAVDHDLYPYRSDDAHDSWHSQDVLHTESPTDHAPISSPHSMHVEPAPSESPTSVKIEPDDPDSRFIMELTAFPPQSSSSSQSSPESYPAYNDSQPPTEVPLRATQASKQMRRMMGVFRLNPFAMHSLSRGGVSEDSPDPSPTGSATWCGEAGPLDEEPVMFEFQLDISGLDREEDGPVLHAAEPSSRLPAISAHDESQLRAFSPTFELHEGDLPERASSSTGYNIQPNLDQQQAIPEKDPGTDFRQAQCDPWEEADYAPHAGSDSGTSSSTTVSVRTPLNETSCSPFDNPTLAHMQGHLARGGACAEQTQPSPIVEFPSTPLWDVPEVPNDYQVQEGPGADPSVNYGHTDSSDRGGNIHPNTSHPFMRVTYQTPSYPRRTYPQPNAQFQQAQGQSNFFLSMPTNHSPYNARRLGVQESSPSQEIEHIPQSPSTLSPLSPATPNSLQYHSINQQHTHYQSQHPSPSQHHQMPVYSASNPVTPTSMPLRLPISIARSAMRSAAAFSNAGSPTSCHSQLPSLSPYNMHSSGRGYRVSRRPHPEERITEHEVYSTPHSPVTEDNREGYIPSSPMVNMGVRISAPMHPVLQRSSTYAGGHPVPQFVNGGAVGSAVHGHANTNNRRWSLPEMTVGAYAPAVGHSESFLGHHM